MSGIRLLSKKEVVEALREEIRMMSHLNHPNIIGMLEPPARRAIIISSLNGWQVCSCFKSEKSNT